MNKINVAVFTAARSDFGIMKKTILRLNQNRLFNFYLVVGSAHLSRYFGMTINEINKVKIKKKIIFNFSYSKSSKIKGILENFSNTMLHSQKFFDKKKIDCAIIMGDRYEMMAFAIACINNNIPIAHVCGGSETFGSIDNEYRNSISQMSKFHFVETQFHENKLKRMGIYKNIYNVGAPALENLDQKLNKFSIVKKKFFPNIDMNKKIIISCFHPETTESINKNLSNLNILIRFLNSLEEHNVIFTYPNADIGYKKYIKILKKKLNKNFFLVSNLGIDNYYSVLKNSDLLIGNSSSGIIESASFNLPTINLGNRQKNRFAPKNVHHCQFDLNNMKKISKTLLNKKQTKYLNPYFKKNTSKKIVKILLSLLK